MSKLKHIHLFSFLALFLISNSSYADYTTGEVNPERATASELLMLPELCRLRFKYGHGSIEFKKWENILGPESLHIHHYCEGLVDIQRAKLILQQDTRNRMKKNGLLESAKANFNYVLTRVQNPKFVMLPDLYYRMAIVASEQKDSTQAISYAKKSIEAKKSYLNPYILLSETYLNLGNRNEAKKTLLQAKQYHPHSKRLKSRLKKIN